MRLMLCLIATLMLTACGTTHTPAPAPRGAKVYADPNTEVYISGGIRADAVVN